MAKHSLNGWPEITPVMAPDHLVTVAIPGTKSHIRTIPLLAPLWANVLSDVNRHVLAIDGGDGPACWVDRPARLGGGLSNHASATAVDVRWDVLKADHRRHCSPGQITAAHAILAHYVTSRGKRILGWGGDWRVGTACDEMHWELGQDWEPGVGSAVTSTDVQDVIKRLGLTVTGARKVVKVPTKVPARHVIPFPGVFREGAHGAYVTYLQQGLVRRGYHLTVDGKFGPQTVSAVKDFQRKNRLGVADGIVGPKTYAAATK
jgi:hypothetical protein